MRFLVSLFWGFVFAFIALFIITSILGDNGISQGISIVTCSIVALLFALASVGLDSLVKTNKDK